MSQRAISIPASADTSTGLVCMQSTVDAMCVALCFVVLHCATVLMCIAVQSQRQWQCSSSLHVPAPAEGAAVDLLPVPLDLEWVLACVHKAVFTAVCMHT